MTSLFRFDHKDGTYTPVFQEAVALAVKLLRDRKLVTGLATPIVMMYPKAKGKRVSSEKKIGDLVVEVINVGFEVAADAQCPAIIMLYNNQLCVNPQFLHCDETNEVERERCLLLLTMKLLHAVFCSLTNTFHILTGHGQFLERDASGAILRGYPTPLTVGLSYGPSRTIVGDNGYAFEEYFLKGRLGPGRGGYGDPLVLQCPTAKLSDSPTYIVPDDLVRIALDSLRKTKLTRDDMMKKLCLLSDKPQECKPEKEKRQPVTSSSSSGKKRMAAEQAQAASKKAKSKRWVEVSLMHVAQAPQAASSEQSDESEEGVDPVVHRMITSQHWLGGRSDKPLCNECREKAETLAA